MTEDNGLAILRNAVCPKHHVTVMPPNPYETLKHQDKAVEQITEYMPSHSPEPWTIERAGEYANLLDADDDRIVEKDGTIQLDDLERIVACVNACQGIPTEQLENLAKAQLPLPNELTENAPAGDIISQAHAWQAVWKKLWDGGMAKYLPRHLAGGKARALEFIEILLEYYHNQHTERNS